ncbi:SapC family protein [Roseibium sp.]|uniref:SapC family protein n=1 Tax=Roseibium sp. TaxID=1936156 RepID=UPI003A9869B7
MTLSEKEVPARVGTSSEDKRPGRSSLPQFYASATVLSANEHANLRLKPPQSYGFAARARSLPLNAVEFAHAALSYPIVFVPGGKAPAALAVVGLREKENLFVDDLGRWEPDAYVPAYARRYPFIVAQVGAEASNGAQFTLCADLESGFFAQDTGSPLFDAGKPSRHAKEALRFCLSYQQGTVATDTFIQKLLEYDLLVPKQGRFTLASGEDLHPPNFLTVSEERLKKLGDAAHLDLRRNGWLPVIHAQLLSQLNWTRLLSRADRRSSG